MVLTGRAGLLAVLGVLPVLISPWPATMFVVVAVVIGTMLVADVLLAASLDRLELRRTGDTTARLGQPVHIELEVHHVGKRRLRGQIRDAWAPSARARPRVQRLDIPAGGRAWIATELAPVRRGDQHAAHVTVRAIGPLGFGQGASARRTPTGRYASCRRSCRASISRRGWPDCATSTEWFRS